MILFEKADLTHPAHGEAILFIMDEYANGLIGGEGALPQETRANLISTLNERSDCHVILGMDDGTPVGVAICFEGFSTFACQPLLNIHDFAISPPYRGQGLATVMLVNVEAMARDLGCGKLTLEVRERNDVAKHVYEKYGFAGYDLDPTMGKALFLGKKISR
ncbi:MAG: GNAT family N-acetyltransferase [Akkermansiaceae bacterium]